MDEGTYEGINKRVVGKKFFFFVREVILLFRKDSFIYFYFYKLIVYRNLIF